MEQARLPGFPWPGVQPGQRPGWRDGSHFGRAQPADPASRREPAIRSDAITAIRMPDGIDERDVRAHARSESGVMLSGGQGDLARIVLQIGHMGLGAYPLGPVIGLTAVGRALRALGAQGDIGAAVEAAVSARES